ncbi:MAG: hypothetical protein ABL993_06000 [Vicinamibacterales bacterium]
MDQVFAAVEASALSTWLREDLWAFPVILIFHTVGLAFLAGPNVAVNARLLGVASGVPLASLERYFVVAWLGFWLNAASGVLLLISYPTKALTNPLFYGKLALIAAAMVMMRTIRRELRRDTSSPNIAIPMRMKLVAAASLACWGASITAGRLLAYTYSRLLVNELR